MDLSAALPSTGLEHRPDEGDKYSLGVSDWKNLWFPAALVRDARGLEKESGACVDPSFPWQAVV